MEEMGVLMNELNSNRSVEKERLIGETLLFSLLGKLVYSPPELGDLQALVDENIFQEIPLDSGQPEMAEGQAFLLSWTENCTPRIQKEQFEAIESDHLRLFVGPGKLLAAPWESVLVNEDHLLFQEETLDVRRWYHRYGYQVENQYHEPDDHLGLELIFLAQLSRLALETSEAGNEASFEIIRADQRRFLNEHTARWAPAWCDLVVQHAQTDYYRGLALLVKGAVKELSLAL